MMDIQTTRWAAACMWEHESQGTGRRTFMPRDLRRKGLSIFCHSMPRAGKAV